MGFSVFRIILFFLFVSAKTVFASSVIINEFSSANTSDWIELYNTSDSEVNLQEWIVKDTTNNAIWDFSSSSIIPSNGFCTKDVGNRLNNKGDRIQLFQGAEEKDCVAYGNGNGSFCNGKEFTDIDESLGGIVVARKPNGTGNWTFNSSTYGYSNDDTQEPETKVLCYIPSPTPTPTLTPTSSPTSTPTKSPTPSKLPTPTKSPTPTPLRPSGFAGQAKSPTQTLTPSPSPTVRPTEVYADKLISLDKESSIGSVAAVATASTQIPQEIPKKSNIKYILIIAVIFFLAGSAFLFYTAYRNGKKDHNEEFR